MKKIIIAAGAAILATTACAPEAEDKVENAYEDQADALEERAEEIRDQADAKADKLEAKADRVDDMADPMADKVEAGTLDKSEAMPGNVVDNDKNSIEEAVR